MKMKKSITYLSIILFFVAASCSKDKEADVITVEQNKISLYYEDTQQINATSKSSLIYASENEYHATVSKDGLVKARYVGETEILLTNDNESKKLQVTVKPRYNLYTEPVVEFGMSKSSVIAKFGKPDVEIDGGILYENYSDNAPLLMFFFDANNKVSSSSVMVITSKMTSLASFLGERYFLATEKGGTYLFANGITESTITLGVGVSLYSSSYMQVTYVPYSPLKSSVYFDKSKIDTLMNFVNQKE